MSKSYRYDPESGSFVGKQSLRTERANKSSLNGSDVGQPIKPFTEGWDWKNNRIDKEWIVTRLEKRVKCVVESLICDNLICEWEREDYIERYNWMLIKQSLKYDPTRVGYEGKTSSPLHFMRIVDSGVALNIRDYALYRKKHFRRYTLAQTVREAKETPEAICVEESRISDYCRSIKELEFRMDVLTLEKELNEEGKIFLQMRLHEQSHEKIAESIAIQTRTRCDRDHVRKVVAPYVQAIARKLGFSPLSEN